MASNLIRFPVERCRRPRRLIVGDTLVWFGLALAALLFVRRPHV